MAASSTPPTPSGPEDEVQHTSIIQNLRDREFARIRGDLAAAARPMPAEHYDFRPVETIRSFADEIAHATAVNERLCGLAQGDTTRASMSTTRDGAGMAKADLVAALDGSLRQCDAAFRGATDQSVLAPTFGPYNRASHLISMVGHNSVVYGKLAIMLRMKGLVPPSTARAR